MKHFLAAILFGGAVSATLPAASHEVWLEPEAYVVEPGAAVTAALRNGERFKGIDLIYNPRDFRRFDWRSGAGTEPVQGRMGDRPAATVESVPEGLLTLIYQSGIDTLTYTRWKKFVAFAEHKDLGWALEAHARLGLPTDRFVEAYARYVKALIGVGSSTGTDTPTGLETEIVALANPYTETLREMPVRVLYKGMARVDAQVEVFEKTGDGSVEITLYRTDSDGVAIFPVAPGASYLVDAVVLREPSDALAAGRGVVWETLWAALTFGVPGD